MANFAKITHNMVFTNKSSKPPLHVKVQSDILDLVLKSVEINVHRAFSNIYHHKVVSLFFLLRSIVQWYLSTCCKIALYSNCGGSVIINNVVVDKNNHTLMCLYSHCVVLIIYSPDLCIFSSVLLEASNKLFFYYFGKWCRRERDKEPAEFVDICRSYHVAFHFLNVSSFCHKQIRCNIFIFTIPMLSAAVDILLGATLVQNYIKWTFDS